MLKELEIGLALARVFFHEAEPHVSKNSTVNQTNVTILTRYSFGPARGLRTAPPYVAFALQTGLQAKKIAASPPCRHLRSPDAVIGLSSSSLPGRPGGLWAPLQDKFPLLIWTLPSIARDYSNFHDFKLPVISFLINNPLVGLCCCCTDLPKLQDTCKFCYLR